MLDALGLGLRLDPRFFSDLSVISISGVNLGNRVKRCRNSDIFPNQSAHVVIGDAVIAIARDYIPQKSTTPPVLVIAALTSPEAYEIMLMNRDPELGESSSFGPPSEDKFQISGEERPETSSWILSYAQCLHKFLKIRDGNDSTSQSLLFTSILVLLHFDALEVQYMYRNAFSLWLEVVSNSASDDSNLFSQLDTE